jgi:ABC-type transport system involved in multi-copper enzyme maturation permease subunit
MTASLGRIWALALNTFREAARIKVLYGVLVVVVGINFLAIVLGEISLTQQARVARDVGLFGISLFGAVTAIVLGVVLLYREIERRTIYAIVSKPIARWEFVVGKYVGMVLILTLLVAGFAVAMAAILAYQGLAVSSAVVKAMVLAWFEVLTVAAVAVFFSSFSTPFLSGIFSLSLWAIGRVTPALREAAGSAQTGWIEAVAKGALAIVPDLNVFSISGGQVDGEHVTVHGDFVDWGYVATAALHGGLWIAALLVLACAIFRRRDFV